MRDLFIEVKPNSKVQSIIELKSNILEARVKSQAKEGQANAELIELLSKHYQIPKSCFEIRKGLKSSYKRIRIL